MTDFTLQPATMGPSIRALRLIGAIGALLALIVLGASILLRLTTLFGADGVPVSILTPSAEGTIRLVHRLAASSVGLLALAASILCWGRRKVAPGAVQPVIWIVAATVLLAVIGPLTPGYRFNAVTVTNVVAGTVLVVSCWWLCETPMAPDNTVSSNAYSLRMAFAVLGAHVGLGAATSAYAMHGIHWVAFLHTGSAMLAVLLIGSILWDRRQQARLVPLVWAMACFLIVQVALGFVSLWMDQRPLALSFVHAMLSPLLAAGLVSIFVRGGPVLAPVRP
jgi:heme A synthase